MRFAGRSRGLCFVPLLLASSAFAQQPLDILDPSPRDVLVEVENSADLSVVGLSFGPPHLASYSATGNVGTLVIPVASHEDMRSGFLTPVPGTFTPIVIQIDLTTLSATSQAASGILQNGNIGMAFTQNPLSTEATAGYISGGDIPGPHFCTSQAEVDQACLTIPAFCSATCVLVPGALYDVGTGTVNLVGSEQQEGCDGAICSGPFFFFSERGDLRLTEPAVAEVPTLGRGPLFICTLLLLGIGRHAIRPIGATVAIRGPLAPSDPGAV